MMNFRETDSLKHTKVGRSLPADELVTSHVNDAVRSIKLYVSGSTFKLFPSVARA